MMKWIIGLLLVVALAAGVWWSGVLEPYMPGGGAQQMATTTPETPTPQATQPQSDLPTAGSDTTDAALTQDLAAVDAEIQALVSDAAALDSGLNDKPVTQEF